MNKYMLLMRGSQSEFIKMSGAEQEFIINEHLSWSKQLDEENILIDGNGFSCLTVKVSMVNGELVTENQPYTATPEELSGYYIIQADSDEAALEIAKQCPALLHGESVEVIPLGH